RFSCYASVTRDVRARNSEVKGMKQTLVTAAGNSGILSATGRIRRGEPDSSGRLPSLLPPLRARCPLDLTATMAVLLVAHSPDGLVAVFAEKQAAVFRDGDSDRGDPRLCRRA